MSEVDWLDCPDTALAVERRESETTGVSFWQVHDAGEEADFTIPVIVAPTAEVALCIARLVDSVAMRRCLIAGRGARAAMLDTVHEVLGVNKIAAALRRD